MAHEKQPFIAKKCTLIIRSRSEKQLPLGGFGTPFETALVKTNAGSS